MDGEIFKSIYLEYLEREPTREEWQRHQHKDQLEFRKEITLGEERQNILRIASSRQNIAILLSGHIRSFTILNGIREAANKYRGKYNINVFVFAWDNIGLKGNETNTEDKCDPKYVEDLIRTIPGLTAYKIENNKEYVMKNPCKDVFYFNHSSPEPFIKSQLYSIYNSYKLMEQHMIEAKKTYAMVLKARMDSDLETFNIDDFLLREMNENKIIFTPNNDCKHKHPDYGHSCYACDTMYYKYGFKKVHIFEHNTIICDVYAYGSQESMKDYCYLYEHYDRLNKQFYDENVKSLNSGNISTNHYHVQDNVCTITYHEATMYYFNCSYPERLLQKHLRKYMLVASDSNRVNIRWRR